MKYKVIAFAPPDGIIIARKSRIMCVPRIHNDNGDPVDYPKIGHIEDDKHFVEWYWSYSRKEWDKINKEFKKIK